MDIQELTVILSSKLSYNNVILANDERKISQVGLEASKTFIDQQKWTLFNIVRMGYTVYDDMDLKKCDIFKRDFLSVLRPIKISVNRSRNTALLN